MRMKKAVLALLAGGLLLPVASSAGRVDGFFETQDSTSGLNNRACTITEGILFGLFGDVSAVNGECLVIVSYDVGEPHKASATALKGSKTSGTNKVSQSIFVEVDVAVVDNPGGGLCPAANLYTGFTEPEKCKGSVTMKGTENAEPTPDAVDSAKVKVDCELGEGGSGLGPTAPTAAQFDTVTAAFATRDDVKFDNKGKVKIKQDGVPGAAGVCD